MHDRVLGNRTERLGKSFRTWNHRQAPIATWAREALNAAKGSGAKTERERAYLAAVSNLYRDFESTPQQARLLAYRNAMRDVAAKYPEDHEAADLLRIGARRRGRSRETRPTQTSSRQGQSSRNCLRRSRRIPGWPTTSSTRTTYRRWRGERLSRRDDIRILLPMRLMRCICHHIHLPAWEYWQASIDSNVAAAAAARRQGQTAEELHASDYETYAYLQTGQDEAAGRIVRSVPEMASRFDPDAVLIGAGPPSAGYFALAAIPARYALERRDWQQAEQLAVRETPVPFYRCDNVVCPRAGRCATRTHGGR